jgi:hypothetical protein
MAQRALQETSYRWIQEWKQACDKFQDFEEERIDFLKTNLWTYANIMSTVCVSDDESCEKIRVNLEKCEVDEVIHTFISARGTGQEIPGTPRASYANKIRQSTKTFIDRTMRMRGRDINLHSFRGIVIPSLGLLRQVSIPLQMTSL